MAKTITGRYFVLNITDWAGKSTPVNTGISEIVFNEHGTNTPLTNVGAAGWLTGGFQSANQASDGFTYTESVDAASGSAGHADLFIDLGAVCTIDGYDIATATGGGEPSEWNLYLADSGGSLIRLIAQETGLLPVGSPPAYQGPFTLDEGDDIELTAAAGTYSYTGYAATLDIIPTEITLVADAGTYGYTGYDATLDISVVEITLTADSGIYSYTGYAATLDIIAGILLVADTGTYSHTGYDATLDITFSGILLVADTGAYALTGSDADLDIIEGFIIDQQAVLQVYTAPKAAGGVPRGPLPLTRGTVVESLKGEQGVSLSIARRVFEASGMQIGDCIRVWHARRGTSEWIVAQILEQSGARRDVVQVQAVPVRVLLATRGLVRDLPEVGSPNTTFTPGVLPADDLIRDYVLRNAAADDIAWMELGEAEGRPLVDIGQIKGETRGAVLDTIERAASGRVELRRVGDGKYAIDLKAKGGAVSGTPIRLSTGYDVEEVARTTDVAALATEVVPRASTGDLMELTVWRIGAVKSGGWCTLVDPAGGGQVVREDDQLDGLFLLTQAGEAEEIIGSRASDSAVQLADVTSFVAGATVMVGEVATGRAVASLRSPEAVGLYGLISAVTEAPAPATARNLAANPLFRLGTTGWRSHGAASGGADVWGRGDPASITGKADGTTAQGSASIAVRDFPSNAVIRLGAVLRVDGPEYEVASSVVPDTSGNATVPISGTLAAAIPAGSWLRWFWGLPTSVPSFPVQADGNQSGGAGSIALKGFPPTVNLTIGDILRVTLGQTYAIVISAVSGTAPTWTLAIDPMPVDIPMGTTLWVTEQHLVLTQGGNTYLSAQQWSGVTTALVTAGGTSITLTEDVPRVPPPTAGDINTWFDSALSYLQDWTDHSYTLTSAPAWDTARSSTPGITPSIERAIPANRQITWVRSGSVMGTLLASAASVSDPTLTVTNTTQLVVEAGQKIAIPAFVAYASQGVALDGAGAGTVPVVIGASGTTPSTVVDGTDIVSIACQDLAASEPGSDTVVRLRGNYGLLPGWEQSGAFQLYSEPVLVTPSDRGPLRAAVGVTVWSTEPQPSGTNQVWLQLWDADTHELLASADMYPSPVVPPYADDGSAVEHRTIALEYALTTTRRVVVSLTPKSGFPTARGSYLFLRWVMCYQGPAGVVAIDGSHSNALWHRAQDVLEARRSGARYKVTMARGAKGPRLKLDAPVRLLDERLGIDETLRIQRIEWNTHDPDAIRLEVAAITPRLTDEVGA